MNFKVTYQGKSAYGDWPHFAWIVDINGVQFKYKTGIGHATPYYSKKGTRNKKPDKEYIALNGEWIHIPDKDSVLECLFADYEFGLYSFDDFCDNGGYSSDSIKAFETYRVCMENVKKLRKALGGEFSVQHERIQALNS